MQITINTQEEHPDTLRMLAELLSQMSSTQPITNSASVSQDQNPIETMQPEQTIESNINSPASQQETPSNPYQIPNLFEQDTNSQAPSEQSASGDTGMIAFNNLFDNYNIDEEKAEQQKTTQSTSEESSGNRIVFY